MNALRRRALLAGVALILVANALTLLGVQRNRDGEPESVLQLTQRELGPPLWRGNDADSSMLGLQLRARVLTDTGQTYFHHYGAAEFLDEAKLRALGYDIESIAARQIAQGRHHGWPPRRAYYVLEFNGAAYAESLRRAGERAAAKPAPAQPGEPADEPARRLENEAQNASRLFIIDVGFDPAALRAQYAERSRYAIVQGSLRVDYRPASAGAPARLTGHLGEMAAGRINVPREHRDAFDPVPRSHPHEGLIARTPYAVHVAFGSRFEPWIVTASRGR